MEPVHTLARAAAEGAEKAGANVRLRKVAERAPQQAIDAVIVPPVYTDPIQFQTGNP